ncbi:MAG: hypothetical protein E7606_02530 [Ruminococcaceae bacterium]|nr:hypothetical protein [Oscillospiraceae bacterium]
MPFSLLARARTETLLNKRNYFSYLSSLLQKTQFFHVWRYYTGLFRKFKFVSLLLRLYSYLLLLLQFGTAFFVIVLGILLLLPLLVLSVGSVIFSALLLYRRENKRLASLLKEKRVTVFFPTRDGELERGDFWKAHIQELSEQEDNAVLIISPFFWSGKGMTSNRFYLLLRKEKENVYLLRKHYYFSLRRAILDKMRDSLALIY